MSTTRHELLHAFDLLLAPERFRDYGPNGLQVEGQYGLSGEGDAGWRSSRSAR